MLPSAGNEKGISSGNLLQSNVRAWCESTKSNIHCKMNVRFCVMNNEYITCVLHLLIFLTKFRCYLTPLNSRVMSPCLRYGRIGLSPITYFTLNEANKSDSKSCRGSHASAHTSHRHGWHACAERRQSFRVCRLNGTSEVDYERAR